MSLTDAQRTDRMGWLGGTDAAALAGVNPPGWAQPIDVYLEKVGQAPPRNQSRSMALGHLMEDVVAQLATEATGMRWRRVAKAARSREYPWAGGHLDRVAQAYDATGTWVPGEGDEPDLNRAILECKWSMGRRDEWGEQGTTIVPLRYAVQVQHYLAVTGRPVAILGVLLGYAEFRWYRLERNEAMIATLMELEERFWREHVLAGVAPDPDGSEAYTRAIRRQHTTDDGGEAIMTPEQVLLADQLRQLRAEAATVGELVAKAEQRLQLSMGSNAVLRGEGVTITWRQNKPSQKVQWVPLVGELAKRLGATDWPETKKGQEEYVRNVARTAGLLIEEPGARPFRVEFASDEEA